MNNGHTTNCFEGRISYTSFFVFVDDYCRSEQLTMSDGVDRCPICRSLDVWLSHDRANDLWRSHCMDCGLSSYWTRNYEDALRWLPRHGKPIKLGKSNDFSDKSGREK